MICKKCRKIIPDDSSFCLYCGTSQNSAITKHGKKKKQTRRKKGSGCVVYLGGGRANPYGLRITNPKNSGLPRYSYLGYYPTEKEADTALAEQEISPITSDARITFSALFERWKKTRAYTDLSQSTKYNYNASYNHYSPIHSKAFADLKAHDFEECIYQAKKIVKKQPVPLSASAKRHMKIFAGLLTKYALENDIIRKGYAEFIRLEKSKKTERETFSENDIKVFEKNDMVLGVDIILILIYSGMRVNELLNVEKSAVNIEEGTITGGLKTDAGRDRVVPIHPKIGKYIENYYNTPGKYLFNRPGTDIKLSYGYFSKNMYKPAIEKLGIEYKDIHCTRHTLATLLKKAGADNEAIKQILGHSNYAFTADTYTHVDVDFLRSNINLI